MAKPITRLTDAQRDNAARHYAMGWQAALRIPRGDPDENLSLAMMAVVHGGKTHNPGRGCFATLLKHLIRSYRQRSRRGDGVIYTPEHSFRPSNQFFADGERARGMCRISLDPRDGDAIQVPQSREPDEAARDIVTDVRDAIKRLPSRDRKIVRMAMKGKTDTDIGRAFGVSREVARQWRHEAYGDLRGRLEAYGVDDA